MPALSVSILQHGHRLGRFLLGVCMLLFLSSTGLAASPRRLLILAPHEDDETLGCAGIIAAAVRRGDHVRVVVATNGDKNGVSVTRVRISETLAAMSLLGVKATDVTFLGYGDATLADLYQAPAHTPLVSAAGMVATYAAPPLALDYHAQRFRRHARYTRANFGWDLSQILSDERPSDIYVTGLYDTHPDHAALFQFTIDAVVALKRRRPRYAPVVHQYLIHAHDDDALWPSRTLEHASPVALTPPWSGSGASTWDWEERESIPVPQQMLAPASLLNQKYQAIGLYQSQKPFDDGGFLYAFVKADECFFPIDLANIAPLAKVTASSERSEAGQGADHIADGKSDGAPRFARQEWVTLGEGQGAWVQLSWRHAQRVERIVFSDRPNLNDQVLAGDLIFSDGSRVRVGSLPNGGVAHTVRFAPRKVKWIRFVITEASGHEIGLSELQVFGD